MSSLARGIQIIEAANLISDLEVEIVTLCRLAYNTEIWHGTYV